MGAWGYYPTDSDGAHDMFSEFYEGIDAKLEEITQGKLGYGKPDYAYPGVIMMLLEGGFRVKRKFVVQAIECLKAELKATERENKSGWVSPQKAIKTMKHLIAKFEEIIDNRHAIKLVGRGSKKKNATVAPVDKGYFLL